MSAQSGLNRRGFLTRISAAGGALLLGGCDQLSQSPTVSRHSGQSRRRDSACAALGARRIDPWHANSAKPTCRRAFQAPMARSNVEDASYRDAWCATVSPNWRLKIDGLVERPTSFSLAELRAFAVAHADHAPRLRRRLERHRQMERRASSARCSTEVDLKPNARYLVFHCADDDEPWRGPTTRASI